MNETAHGSDAGPRPLSGPRFLAFAAITLWGLSFVATRVALAEIAPVPLIAARLVLGFALLVGLLASRGELGRLCGAPFGPLALLGLFGIAAHLLVQAYALRLTSAVHTGWLIGLTPIWSALLAAVLLRERFTPLRVVGLGLGFAGALLVVTRGRIDATTLALPSAKGDLLILLTTVNWAVYTIAGRRVLRGLDPRVATTVLVGAGLVAVLPVAWATGGLASLAHLSARAWAAVLFLGIGCSGLGYLFWSSALERLPASQVASFLYLEPLVTLAAAALYLHEPVGVTTVVGGIVVLVGVALVQRPAPGPAPSPAPAARVSAGNTPD